MHELTGVWKQIAPIDRYEVEFTTNELVFRLAGREVRRVPYVVEGNHINWGDSVGIWKRTPASLWLCWSSGGRIRPDRFGQDGKRFFCWRLERVAKSRRLAS